MADPTLYIGADELREWISDDPTLVTDADDNSRDPMLQSLILAACRQVDDDCGRIFYQQTATPRTYYPDRFGHLRVVDLLSAAPTITIDLNQDNVPETVLATTDYVLSPYTEETGLGVTRYQAILRAPFGAYTFASVSYTHLTLPTNSRV